VVVVYGRLNRHISKCRLKAGASQTQITYWHSQHSTWPAYQVIFMRLYSICGSVSGSARRELNDLVWLHICIYASTSCLFLAFLFAVTKWRIIKLKYIFIVCFTELRGQCWCSTRSVVYLWKPSTILRWLQRSFLVRCSSMRASTRHSMNVLRYWGRPRLGSHSLPTHSWLISP